MKKLPPLLNHHSPALRIVLAFVVPSLFGVVAGVLLGVSERGYQVFSLLAIAGGFLAGMEHVGARGGMKRGLVGGSAFGAFILLAHGAFFDSEPKAHIPEPEIVLVVLTTGFGVLLGGLGGRRRARLEGVTSQQPVGAASPATPVGQAVNGQAVPWDAVVNLNEADVEELLLLHPVGRQAAARIVEYRERNGRFEEVAELGNVEGFPVSRVAQIAARATV